MGQGAATAIHPKAEEHPQAYQPATRMRQGDLPLDRNLPPCSRTMVNAIKANIVTQQHYRRPTRYQRMPKTPETIAPSR